ncbi:hypothetical protein K501DRAFT_308649 [Backusella circina FSU 941]|nr:hypothetical protein K501DRAFT_308649 [Backusella circina FSU 941]
MTVMMRQFRSFVSEPIRRNSASSECNNKKKRKLSVTICKDPPDIIYFERDKLEESFECIYDPQVDHDNEEDHPDLLFAKKFGQSSEVKPWQKPPYTTSDTTLMSRFKAPFKNFLPVQQSS